MIGELDGPVGQAFASLLGDQVKGHTRVLALLTLTERDWTRALGNLSAAAFAGWGVWYLNRPPVEQQFTPPAPATPPTLPPSNPQER